MLPAPNRFNPIQDYDTSVQLRNRVIDRMAQLGMISPEAAASARRSRIEISPQAKKSLSSTIAPYFYSYVFEELQDLLGEEVAKEGNFIVETSLDRQLQAIADREVRLRCTSLAIGKVLRDCLGWWRHRDGLLLVVVP